eukprot:TRINITY_DN36032_c0_g1_i1.p1 TRINITY_DN36032_c0_g1~~TRINITY_DN36032_c0_g1_i1.p1  ORF type:complete len:714 (-),score=85.72 TRINITY_DN36032_c0_g1_i1:141-2282(-)
MAVQDNTGLPLSSPVSQSDGPSLHVNRSGQSPSLGENISPAVSSLASSTHSVQSSTRDAAETPKEGLLSIRGFPRNWGARDLRTLLHGAVEAEQLLCVDMMPPAPGGDPAQGFARVRFESPALAQKASDWLFEQKVAGQPLVTTMEEVPAKSILPSPVVNMLVTEQPSRDKDPGRPSYQDYDRDGVDKPRKWKTEICRHFGRGYCKLGDRCNFAHGETQLSSSASMSSSADKTALVARTSKDEDLRRGAEDTRRGGGKSRFIVIHIDELDLTRRPRIEPAPTDREVFVDPMPEQDLLSSCLAAFGDVDEVSILPQQYSDRRGRRGYVKFTDHSAAARCVRADFGAWSESERILSSQKLHRQYGANSGGAYPDSVIARFVGARGAEIQRLQEECGATWLHLRGEDLGRMDFRFPSSSRVHFIAEGDERTFERVRGVLERRLADIHGSIQDRIRDVDERARHRAAQEPNQLVAATALEPCKPHNPHNDVASNGGGANACGGDTPATRLWGQQSLGDAHFGSHHSPPFGWGAWGAPPHVPPHWHYGCWGYPNGHTGHQPPPAPGWLHYPPPREGYPAQSEGCCSPPPVGSAWGDSYPSAHESAPPPGGECSEPWWNSQPSPGWAGCTPTQPPSQSRPVDGIPVAVGNGSAPSAAPMLAGTSVEGEEKKGRRGAGGRGYRKRRRRKPCPSSCSSYYSGESVERVHSPPAKRRRRRSR